MGFHSRARVTKSRTIARVVAPPAQQIFSPSAAATLTLTGQIPSFEAGWRPSAAATLTLTGQVPSFWTPLALPGLLAWFDANQINGVNNNDPLTTWPDVSGGSHDASGTTKPTYKTAQQNGHPAVDWADATSQQLKTGALTLAQPATVWVACKTNTTAPGVNSNFVCDGIDGTNRMAIFANGSGINKWTMFAGTSLVGSVTLDTNWHLLIATFNGASSTLTVDGASAASGNAGSNSLAGISLGVSFGGLSGAELDGLIGEIGYASGVLSASSLANLKSYISIKWAITVS